MHTDKKTYDRQKDRKTDKQTDTHPETCRKTNRVTTNHCLWSSLDYSAVKNQIFLNHPRSFYLNILQRYFTDSAEANQENIRTNKTLRPNSVKIFLSSSVEQLQRVLLLLHGDVDGEGVHHGGLVLCGDGAGHIGQHHSCLAHRPVPHHHALDDLLLLVLHVSAF